ncbi:hypothetical protein KJ640_07445 [bacterium]|nr:hypothetical protein [bacterium]
MKKILWVVGIILSSFVSLSLAQEEKPISLFPHQILVNDRSVVKLEGLNEPIKIEVSGLAIGIDPAGSMTISSPKDWLSINIDSKGTISLASSLSLILSPERAKKRIRGINKLSLKDDLSSGKIELILEGEMGLDKKDMLIFPLIWKAAKGGYRAISEEKGTIEIRRNK